MKLGNDSMTVFKALKDGVSPYQRYAWPLPVGDQPGDWVTAADKPKLCVVGVHGYLTRAQAAADGNQVFEMEIEGDIVKDTTKAAGRRGRLLRQLSGPRVVTLGDLLGQGKVLGVKVEAVVAALKPQNIYVVDDNEQLIRLEDYWKTLPDMLWLARRVKPIAKMPLTVQVGA